jgi:hypothetical protein
LPCNSELIKPPLKASPAPVGFKGITEKIPKFLLYSFVISSDPSSPFL